MKMRLRPMQVIVLSLVCSSCIIQTPGRPSARETAPTPGYQATGATAPAVAQRTWGGIAVVSATSLAGLTGQHLNHFRAVDDKLMAFVKQDLQNRGMSIAAAAQTLGQAYTLAFSIDKVDCGRNQQCQMHATIGASYVLKRYNTVIRSGRFEEPSQFGWEKSARKLAEVIGGETAAGVVIGPAGNKTQESSALPIAPRDEGKIAVRSDTNTAGLTGKRLNQLRVIDASLLKGIGENLQDHGVGLASPQSGAQRYVLAIKIGKVDCGPKDLCQMSATIGASYVFQKDGAILKSGQLEEPSKGGWQKSVNKITERIAGDVAGAMSRR